VWYGRALAVSGVGLDMLGDAESGPLCQAMRSGKQAIPRPQRMHTLHGPSVNRHATASRALPNLCGIRHVLLQSSYLSHEAPISHFLRASLQGVLTGRINP